MNQRNVGNGLDRSASQMKTIVEGGTVKTVPYIFAYCEIYKKVNVPLYYASKYSAPLLAVMAVR